MSDAPRGYWNCILRVDLSAQSYSIQKIDDSILRLLLGGRGLALHFLLRENHCQKSFDEEGNPLIIATGVLTGVPCPALSRFTVASKSPLTGGLGASEAGGFWGPELKFAGFDAVIVEGKAKRPTYLWIHDDKVSFNSAEDVWGLGMVDAEERIHREVGDDRAKVLLIGPAGEKKVRYANIGNGLGHFNGRNGLGAVMGAKNLKGIAVKGGQKLRLHDESIVRQIARDLARNFKDTPSGYTLFEFGTTAMVDTLNGFGALPIRNWSQNQLLGVEGIFSATYNKEILTGRKGCFACPIRCKRVVSVKHPEFSVDSRYGGPEFESIASLGSLCGIVDLRVIARANELCNHYGIDTISLGATVAFAMQCFEMGLLTTSDTDGIELRFGNAGALLEIIPRIAKREGIGDLLAEGSIRAADQIGNEARQICYTVRGQEVPMHDPRIKPGIGIGYVTSDIGADHLVALHDPYFVDDKTPGFLSSRKFGIKNPSPLFTMNKDKAENYAAAAKYWRMLDCIGACLFGFAPRGPMELDTFITMVNAVTGWDTDMDALLSGGERAIVMSRLYNERAGFAGDHEELPGVFAKNLSAGPYKDKLGIDKDEFSKFLSEYYNALGWVMTEEHGRKRHWRPSQSRLQELSLDFLIEDEDKSTL